MTALTVMYDNVIDIFYFVKAAHTTCVKSKDYYWDDIHKNRKYAIFKIIQSISKIHELNFIQNNNIYNNIITVYKSKL